MFDRPRAKDKWAPFFETRCIYLGLREGLPCHCVCVVQAFMAHVCSTVALDLLDASDLLSVLMVHRLELLAKYYRMMSVLGLASLHIALPTAILFGLSHGKYGRNEKWMRWFRVLHRVVYFALVCRSIGYRRWRIMHNVKLHLRHKQRDKRTDARRRSW